MKDVCKDIEKLLYKNRKPNGTPLVWRKKINKTNLNSKKREIVKWIYDNNFL